MSSAKPLIFISYAHLDEPEKPCGAEVAWLTFVMKFLRPAVKSGEFTVWDDRHIPGGLKWNSEIERNLRACDIFVLLVSANSMSSNYIIDKELEIALERHAASDGLHIYPLVIEPTPKAGLDRVQDFNLRPRDAKPLQSYSLGDRNQHMCDAADEIAAIVAKIATRGGGPAPSKSTARAPAFVHISGLPGTGYERLVGRDTEVGRLDALWSDDKTNLVSVVADGGAGQVGLGQRMADAPTSRRLSRRGLRARLVVLQPGFKRAHDRGGRVYQLGVCQARFENRRDRRFRQGRGDRRGANGAPRPACTRRRRTVAAWAGPRNWSA